MRIRVQWGYLEAMTEKIIAIQLTDKKITPEKQNDKVTKSIYMDFDSLAGMLVAYSSAFNFFN